MAAAKGIVLPEQGGTLPASTSKSSMQATAPKSQPSLMSKVTGFFSGIFNTAKQGAINAAEYIGENNPITRAAADIQGSGVKGGLTKFGADLENQIVSGNARFQTNAQGKKVFNPGSIATAAIGAETGGPEGIWDPETIKGLAAESDLTNITKTLTDKGVDPEAAQKISPLISAVKTPAQLQDALTFWEPASGIYGDPNSKPIATAIMLWGMENGYAYKWTCSEILGIVAR